MDSRTKSRKPMGHKWVLEAETLDERLRLWAVYAILKQRNISWQELAEEFGGVSRARVFQILRKAGGYEVVALRVDQAITNITDRRHAAVCECRDPSCPVYTAAVPDVPLRDAKKGAMQAWRDRNVPKVGSAPTTEPMRTAS